MPFMPRQNNSSQDLLRYAGFAAQILVSLGIAVFVGLKLDDWMDISFPLLVWLLPLLVVSTMIFKLIKETSRKQDDVKK